MTRNKSEDSQHPLARRLAPAILLAGGGVAFLAMVDGPQEGISTAALNTVAPTDNTALAGQTTLPSGTSDSTTTTAGSNVCGVSRSTGAQVEFRFRINRHIFSANHCNFLISKSGNAVDMRLIKQKCLLTIKK